MPNLRARMPLALVVGLLAVALCNLCRDHELGAAPSRVPAGTTPRDAVYVARNLSAENLAVLAAALAAHDPSALLLLDTKETAPSNRAFLDAWNPSRVVPIGDYSEGLDRLEERLGVRPETQHPWTSRPPPSFWKEFFPRATTVVVSPPEPRGLLLQAACLAGTLQAPLFIHRGSKLDDDELQHLMHQWQTTSVLVCGPETHVRVGEGVQLTSLKRERDVTLAHRRALAGKGPIHVAVVANPADQRKDSPGMSALAPWLALQRRAALVLVDRDGGNVEAAVTEAVRSAELGRVDTLMLAADLEAIPVRKRKNPVPSDKDEAIEMEPMTPTGTEPFSFSVGRVFHQDPGVVPLLLARQQLLARHTGKPKALVVSNAVGGLPLLETISRQTVRELANGGYQTTAIIGQKADGDEVRKLMPKHDVFLWEGHHGTLIKDWKFADWDEPLPPSLSFLQSCLALKEWKVEGLFRRGAVGVIGSSTRTYSASGGATSLAFFDAVLHDDRNVGDALRSAKNFLQAYVLLKEGRLGDDAKRNGANQRAAWAFTLWGDPTLRLPRPAGSTTPAVTHSVKSNVITVHFPSSKLDPVRSDKYHAEAAANSRLAGLLGKEKGDDGKALQPMVFVEVELPKAPEGKVPHLTSKLPSRSWVFNWDSRRKVGYLLAVPRAKDTEELRFVIKWQDEGSPSASTKPMQKAERE